MELLDALRTHFGHAEFRPGQEAVVQALLAGESALALFPTGAGKSLCYQLPAVLLEGTALIVSPLIALMKDQVDALRARGIAAARLDSTLTAHETQQVYADLKNGALKLLYVAPERLSGEAFIDRLRRAKISLLAIDEAHCISEWGHNFRPEYLRLARVSEELALDPVLALTATATPDVARDICKAFGIDSERHVQTSFRRRNLHLRVTPCASAHKTAALAKRLASAKVRPAVVYVTFQKTAEDVAAGLAKAGLAARAYHAGMKNEERDAVQEAFMRGACEIIVATIAFGMGIDKADIRSVIHFNLPKTLENYQQEIGRAGRDGAPALCELLACADDAVPLENFTLGDTPEPAAVEALVRRMLGSGEEFDVSRYDLSQETDIRPLVVETVITYLELDGLLRPTRAFYESTQVEFLKSEGAILGGLNEDRRRFLAGLFKAGTRGPKYLTLELEATAQRLGEPRERIAKALTWLEETGAITQKPAGLRHGFRLLEDAAQRDPAVVAAHQAVLFAHREARDSERLAQILDFATQPGCITRRLLAYFGEALEEENCGHCHFCRTGEPAQKVALPATPIPPFTEEDDELIRGLIFEELPPLATPRQVTRFLCGLTSPATSRAKLTKRPEFARFAGVPFRTVLARVEQLAEE
ncbi:MAG TPA: RecQ family ATP-dependent DNA helicase [Chthoniobacteraceae bacterium]|jgi:ATP-dependent DNA helicase RecQ|nr:RecQ family ATP-dependent DNA helicase [Chthoniobacteraceae bacterium]